MPEDDVYRVLLTGIEPDSGNRGCRALASSVISLIASRTDAGPISFISRRPLKELPDHLGEEVVARLKPLAYVSSPDSGKIHLIRASVWHLSSAVLFRAVPIGLVRRGILRRNSLVKSIVQADFFGDIREGDSFSDLYGAAWLALGSVPALVRIVVGKKVTLLPQTYGPFRTAFARSLASFIMRHSGTICSRDRQGLTVAGDLLGKRAQRVKLMYCPDVAFTLPSTLPSPLEVSPDLGRPSDTILVGVNLSGLVCRDGGSFAFGLTLDCKEFVYELMDRLLSCEGVHIALIPHVFHSGVDDDASVCRVAWENMRASHDGRVHLVTGEYSEMEIKGIIGLCDFFIGGRMHACIAGLSQAVPTVGMAYSRKFIGVFESIGVEECVIDARQTDVESAVVKCMDLFQRRSEIKARLAAREPEVRQQVCTTFDEIMRND